MNIDKEKRKVNKLQELYTRVKLKIKEKYYEM